MKRLTLLVLIVLGTVAVANAQDAAVKLGWAYAFDAEEGGLNIGGKYAVTSEIDIAAGLTFYFPDDAGGVDVDYWMIDFDGHYNFPVATGLKLYPLAGLNFTTVSVEYDDEKDSDTEFGLNIGGGAQFNITGPLAAYLELKYILGDADQGVLGLGLNYSF